MPAIASWVDRSWQIKRNCQAKINASVTLKRYRKIGARNLVPTLVPKPGSLTVTQGNLTRIEFPEARYLRCSWSTLDNEIRSLKIRVSVVRFRPWPPLLVDASLRGDRSPTRRRITDRPGSRSRLDPTFLDHRLGCFEDALLRILEFDPE